MRFRISRPCLFKVRINGSKLASFKAFSAVKRNSKEARSLNFTRLVTAALRKLRGASRPYSWVFAKRRAENGLGDTGIGNVAYLAIGNRYSSSITCID